MSLAEQITDIYLEHEFWHKEKLTREESIQYHQRLLTNGNIITISNGQELVGYVEFERDPWICYIKNLFILPAYRNGPAIWQIKRRLFEVCKGKIFKGERNKNGQRYEESRRRING